MAAHGSKDTPFTDKIPVCPEIENIVSMLRQPGMCRIGLCRLYLMTGRFMPEEAKKLGAYFGYCDESGVLQPKATATHFGWTVAA